MDTHEFWIPDEYELVGFFGTEAVERAVEDGYWSYEVSGIGGTILRFSFNIHERSVQTELRLGSALLATVSHEMAKNLSIVGDTLRCELVGSDYQTTLTVNAKSGYSVVWSTLRTR